MNERYLAPSVARFLGEKMVFLGGPRQVGKTTLALDLLGGDETHRAYLNWDDPRTSAPIRKGELPHGERLIVLDEIHKYARWRNLVKGLYDTNKSRVRFLVTGSARLDHYRKGGDSLQGRYYFMRLHPFSLRELSPKPTRKDVDRLLRFGGFPEPLFRADPDHHRLWQRQRLSRVVREDLRDLEQVKDISLIELLVDLLPARVGSPLSVNSLREDLQVDHKTVVRWLTILENLYVCFRVAPYGAPRIRAVKKEQKLYLWDWSAIEDPGARFENLVASQLLKYCHLVEDTTGHRMELRYLRDTAKREVDFVVVRDRKPLFAVECKSGDRGIGPAVHYFAERVAVPVWYQVHLGDRELDSGPVRVRKFETFCRELDLP
jgi:predicted AAA+ superfamily ATPase